MRKITEEWDETGLNFFRGVLFILPFALVGWVVFAHWLYKLWWG